jgi:hypothetical protein
LTDPRAELVGRGYDVIGERFAEWRDRIVGDPRREWEEELVSRLQDGARVLELGCGAGVPDTQTNLWPGDTFGISTLSTTNLVLSWGSATPSTGDVPEIFAAPVAAQLH